MSVAQLSCPVGVLAAGTIFVAPVYLHNILDPERFPVDQLFDATSFHQAVVKVSITRRRIERKHKHIPAGWGTQLKRSR